MTIDDLIYDVNIDGKVTIIRFEPYVDDVSEVVFTNDNGIYITPELKPYIDEEVIYLYSEESNLIVEIVAEKKGYKNKLCGFVWCRGRENFEVWETNSISEEDQAKIEEILDKYRGEGTSTSNVYKERFDDLFSKDY